MPAASTPEPGPLEAAVREFWGARGLPAPDGLLGAAGGPLVRQYLGSFAAGDPPVQVAMRAVRADVDARYLVLSGRRVFGTLRRIGPTHESDTPEAERLLGALGVWTGGTGGRPWDERDVRRAVQSLVERLARRRILLLRDGPVRLCPHCGSARSPERTIYQEEVGDTYLVRFPVEGLAAPADALVWVDAPWRLLGTSALLVNPELPYVVAEYERDGSKTRLLLARSAIDRLATWIAGATIKVLEELPGRDLVGRAYGYPLRHEFPEGATLDPPAGTIQAVRDVGDSGTGIVPLVPGHGGTDGDIAERLGIVGWPLLTTRGDLDLGLQHKYAGLDLPTANDFVVRDLTDAGSVLARLRVLRGVPYCGVCGHTLIWVPGRAWRLDLGALPSEVSARYERLLPDERPMPQLEVTTWPVSETVTSTADDAVALLECGQCDRLDAPGGAESCPCGGLRRPVLRRLLPAFAGTLAAWAIAGPPAEALGVSPAPEVRLYVGDRRRAPTVVHHLVASSALERGPRDLGLVLVPTIRAVDLEALVREHGADAVRAGLIGSAPSEPSGATLAERSRQERRRLARLRALARELRPDAAVRSGRPPERPLAGPAGEVELEDRAIVARWARVERDAIAAYEGGRPELVYRHVARFVDEDLERYRALVRVRQGPGAPAASRRAVLETLRAVLRSIAVAVAPVAPFSAEVIHRELVGDRASIFETEPWTDREVPLDEDLVVRWEEWAAFLRAVSGFRRERRIPAEVELPVAALVFDDEAVAERFRADLALLGRLARVARIEVGSPAHPWSGKLRRVVPVEAQVARTFPTIAPQVLQLIRRLPPRGPTDRDPLQGISVVVNGLPRPIAPGMLRVSEELPTGVVRAPCSLGELFVGLPPVAAGRPPPMPPVSTDAGWLVRQVARRLRAGGERHFDPRQAPLAIVHVDGPLGAELEQEAAALTQFLGLRELRVVAAPPDPSIPNRVRGRTRTGVRWQVELPETPLPRPAVRSRGRPVRSGRVPAALPSVLVAADDVDYGGEAFLAREAGIRALEVELLQTLDEPVLGPTKVAYAWDAGLRSASDVTGAPHELLAALPGFGRHVANELWLAGGRELPPSALEPNPEPEGGRPFAAGAGAPGPRSSGSFPRPAVRLEPHDGLRPASARSLGTGPDIPRSEELGGPGPALDPRPPEPARPAGPASPGAGTDPRGPAPEVVPHAPLARSPDTEPSPGVDERRPGPEPSTIVLGTDPPPGALDPILRALRGGARGVALVRESPEQLRTQLAGLPASVLWLTTLERPGAVRPDDLDGILARLRSEVQGAGVRAIYLDGVEYLIELHGFARVLELLRRFAGDFRATAVTVWVHVDPALVTASELTSLRAEFGPRARAS